MDGEALGRIEPVLFVRLHLREVLLALLHDDVTGGAGAAPAAVGLEMNVIGQRDVEERARLAVIGQRVFLIVDLDGDVLREERDLVDRHYFSMISSARRLARAPLSAASIMTSARCSVARFSAAVASRISSRSLLPRARRSTSSPVSIAARSSAPTSLAPWPSARSTWVMTVSASFRASISRRASTSASAKVKESSTIRSTSASERP